MKEKICFCDQSVDDRNLQSDGAGTEFFFGNNESFSGSRTEIIKKFADKESAPSAEYLDAFKLVKELFRSGTPVHAVRIDEGDVLQFSGHKLR